MAEVKVLKTQEGQFVSIQILRASRVLKKQANKIIATHSDLALVEWQVLSTIAAQENEPGGSDVSHLHDLAAIDKAQFSRGLTSLIERGCVEKLQNETDRRKSVVKILPEGRAAYDGLMPHMVSRDNAVRAALTEHEQKMLTSILKKIEAAVE